MFIAIEGCVGAGKSTVANGLGKYRRSRVLFENFEANPFLRAFYQNPSENVLETEFAFLLLHFHQLKAEKTFVAASELIADFHLGKDLLYANLNLKEIRAMTLFKSLFDVCSEAAPSPSLIVFLSAPTELLIHRIATRKRDFEMHVDRQYFAAVNEAYEEFFVRYPGAKLRVPMDDWDFLKDETLYRKLSVLADNELTPK